MFFRHVDGNRLGWSEKWVQSFHSSSEDRKVTTMRIGDYIRLALKRLRLRLFESTAIVIAIGLGTGVICVAIALTLGIIKAASQGQFSPLYNAVRVQRRQYD